MNASHANIISYAEEKAPKDLTAEICIIGSGCGGATAARVLSEAGHDVVVLEEGGDYTGEALNQRDAQMYDQLYMDRGGRMTEDMSISILQGRVLGGGGVINACDVVPIPPGVLAFWRKKYGLGDLTEEAIAPYQQQALDDLSASRIPRQQVNRANRFLEQGAMKLRYKGEVMKHNRVGCGGLGTCLIGCPLNAKRNPRFVAIPAALEAGARFLTRVRAVKIENAGAELKQVQVRCLDAMGYHEHATFTIRAKTVIVAANAIASTQLLLRSGLGNEHVGRHISLQPQLPLIAFYKDKVNGFMGIPQSYAVTEFEEEDNPEHGLWGFRIEGIMGTPGIASTLSPYTGATLKEYMAQYAYLASSLLLAPDDPVGTMKLTPSGRPVVQYTQEENHKARLRHATKEASRIYLASGADRVGAPTLPPLEIASESDLAKADSLQFAPATAPMISAHQQGGVRMASSPKNGACDFDAQVYGTRGVYTFDSSWFPSSSSSHTMTPIITMSYYLSNRLLAKLS